MPKRHLLPTVALAALLGIAGNALAQGQATFYSWTDLAGTDRTVANPVEDLEIEGTLPRSALIRSGRWEVCTRPGYRGRCVVLEPGEYRKLYEQFGYVASAREISGIAEDEPTYRRYWARRYRR